MMHLRHWFILIALSFMLAITGCDDDDDVGTTDQQQEQDESDEQNGSDEQQGEGDEDTAQGFTPFLRVAEIPTAAEPPANYQLAQEVADHIATFVAERDEPTVLGEDVIRGGNWIVAGVEAEIGTEAFAEELDAAVLGVPTQQLINPDEAASPANTKKIAIVEICNRTYASMALGARNIIESESVNNGMIHATALPCEVAVHNQDGTIYVDMLNPEAIFTLFFSDVLFGPQMQNEQFAQAMQALPTLVKGEIRQTLFAALDEWQAETGNNYTESDERLGPEFKTIEDVVAAIDAAPHDSPYVHWEYTKQDGGTFTREELTTIAEAIIETATVHGEANAGQQEADLLDQLSEGASWRSARHHPLSMPGGNLVIEMCSPTYAKMAIGSTRLDHATALPCEVSLNINENGNLLVSFLDPGFMFGALFADMSEDEKAQFGNMPAIVLGDIQTLVDYAIDNNVEGLVVNEPEPVTFAMLPAN